MQCSQCWAQMLSDTLRRTWFSGTDGRPFQAVADRGVSRPGPWGSQFCEVFYPYLYAELKFLRAIMYWAKFKYNLNTVLLTVTDGPDGES